MISKRLLSASEYIKGYNVLADCGTDHGYLPIFCLENNYVTKAYASDNKEGPLNNAIANIKQADLEKAVIPVLADGLSYLNEEVDVVSILGMGGRLIISILEKAPLDNVKRLVIIANSENEQLRDFLKRNDWKIVAEELIKEKAKYYQLQVLERGKMELSDFEKEFGPLIIKEKSDIFKEMINKQITNLSKALSLTTNSESIKKIKNRIEVLERVIR